ncbi:MAG TPA: carboxypeptidase-like regulatory domain-containing protein [Thermoanaerobaculia bacterium]
MRARFFAALALLTALPALASINGTVMTRDGQPLTGAKVSIYSFEPAEARRARMVSANAERTPLASTTTNSKGAFTLDSPKDPVVSIRVDATGYAPYTTDIERDEDSLVFAMSAAPVKQGTITANGKPLANAHVVWLGQDGEVVATTDDKGHYSSPDPVKWAGRVVVHHPDFALFDETRGAKPLPLDFSLDAGVPVTGTVVGNDGSPVAKAAITVDTFPVATTGDNGSFTIAHAPKQWQALEVHAADRFGARSREGKSTPTLKLTAAASVSGIVRDARQQPIAGATVLLPNNVPGRPGARGAVASTVTDAKGNYSLTGVKPGNYQIVISHPGYSAAPANLSLTAGARVQKPLVASPRARISGTVVDDDKRPVAAASINADTVSRDPMGLPRNMRRLMAGLPLSHSAFSGPDGRFSLRTDSQGDIELAASKKGLPSAKTSALHITSGEKKSGVTIVMPRGIAISGIVTDKQGKALSGVGVTASENEGGPLPGGVRRMIATAIRGGAEDDETVHTGSDGKFTTRVKEGTYDVIFKREGFSTKSVRGVVANATTKPMEVALEPGVEIAGRVTRGGNGIEGINVAVVAMDNSELGVTGPDGHFTVSDLTPGPYMVVFNKQEEFIQQMRNITAPANNVNIELPPGGRISGRVLDKATHQPVTSFNAGVSTARTGGGMQINVPPMMKSFTSDDGSFTLENVPTGTVQVIASAAGYTTARQANVTIEDGKSVDNIELDLDTGVHLSGHVTGPDGSPLSGVAVRPDSGGGGGGMRIVANFGGADSSTAVTDANGDYSIDQLDPGSKTFSFALEGYLPTSKSVDLSGREARLDAQLSSGLHVTGVVVTDAGAPVPDADIRAASALSGGGGFRATKTDANGAFSFDAMAPGHYSFTASKSGYADGMLNDYDVGSNAPLQIALKTGGVIFGHVSGLGPDDLQHVTVTARNNNGNGEAAVDASGNYRLTGAPTGTVRVTADLLRGIGNAQTTDPQTVDIQPGGSVEVDLTFNTNTIVRGHVTRDGAPVAGGSVSFFPTDRAGAQVTSPVDDSGNYTASGLSDGSYGVMVMDTQRMNPYSIHYDVHGSATFDIDIKTATLTGHVTDAGSGDPVDKARIQMKSKETGFGGMISTRGATTDSSGNFTIDSVTPGTYTITADKDGYGNDVRDVAMTESGAAPVQLTIAPANGVTLTVVDARDGQPLNPAINVFDSAGRNVYQSIFRGMPTGSSSTSIPLSPGQYTATVAAMNYAPRSVSFTSPSSQTVQLTPGGSIIVTAKNTDNTRRARLIDANGAVYARPFSPDATYPIPGTNNTISNIAPGTYRMQVLVNGAIVNTVTVTVAEGVPAPASI